jgi:hypothetical protein
MDLGAVGVKLHVGRFERDHVGQTLPGQLAEIRLVDDLAAGIVGDQGDPVIEPAAIGGEMMLQHLAVLGQLRPEANNEFIVMLREGRIVRIERLAIERRDVELLQKRPQIGRLQFRRIETGRARLGSCADHRSGDDGGSKNFVQDCPQI